jgi:penicillin-insensitive murein DD-endopeptidase
VRPRILHLGFTFALVLVPSFAAAKPAGKPKQAKLEAPAARLLPGKSIGSPTEGRLVGGSRLGDAPYVRVVPAYSQGDVRWGVENLVGAIDRAARAVRKQFADSVLSVGHLSKPGGGELDRHASHESGRDADVGFYVRDQKGKPIYADHFVAFKGDGTAPSWPGAQFDDARNWAFIASMVGDGHAHVTHIFVSTPIRQRLLGYAAKIGAPGNLRVRASELMAQPHGALPHDDHFHIRVACPPGMDKCIEQPLAHHKKKHPHQAASSNATAHAKPGAAAAAPAPKSHAAPAPSAPSPSDESSAASDSSPSLAPIVPGLDSAVIPKPLEIPSPPTAERPPGKSVPGPSATPMPTPVPAPPAIDDPDGVLEGN